MSFFKALFFMLPLAAIAAVAVSYFLVTQWIKPEVDEVLMQLKQSTEVMQTIAEELKTDTSTQP